MNEQDVMLNEKIIKREKFDTILAYVLLVILVGCLLLVLYLKFVRVEDKGEEYVPNYISLNDISTSLNSSILANRYMNDGATFSSSVNDDVLNVSYVKDTANVNLNLSVVGGELVVEVPSENSDIVTDIYKEIASIVCVYYGNTEDSCRNTLNNMGESGNDGIRIINGDNTSTVYINVTRSYTINNEVVYNEVTKVGINDMNYSLNINNIKVSNINIVNTGTSIKFSGNVQRLDTAKNDVSVNIKLYDSSDKVIGEKEYKFNKDNVLESNSTFDIEFVLYDNLKIENIKNYSIDIVK